MKRFTLYSAKYENALRNFAEKAAAADNIYINRICHKRGYAVNFAVADREAFCELLLALLFDIAESENPVYRKSEKLREMAKNLRQTQLYGRELRRLRQFIAGSKCLHIEGYVTFRMGEFREKLDMMIYTLIKKIKFGNEV
ncbi:MAG: hypothetical protein LBI27_09435 [Clostridiales bacterium]|jgi:hypothetical protein|nr:hypothetical protein [Clostridiales bacterium]